jgi:adenylate cyclase
MEEPWLIRVYEKQQLVYSEECAGPVELGRQDEGEEVPYKRFPAGRAERLVIAGRDEDSVSRRHALIEPRPGGRVRVENVSKKVAIVLPDGRLLEPAKACELDLPAVLMLGRCTVRVQRREPESLDAPLEALDEATVAPKPGETPGSAFGTLGLPSATGLENEAVLRWLQAIMGVLQSAASSSDFFPKAAQATVEVAGMDSGRVLIRDGDFWNPVAVHAAAGTSLDDEWQPSRSVLNRVRQERRTYWQVPGQPSDDASSLIGVLSVVVSPILDREGSVIGALYGERRQSPLLGSSRRITKLDAMKVELLAGGVAAGLERLKQEQAALAMHVQFEQFFTPELAKHLAQHPEMLHGQDAEITALFCDIRGFSRISERLGPVRTVEWVGDVMETLSVCVLAQQGVLVDYIGDELIAMWGAPEAQPDHAVRACRAAIDMLHRLADLNARWVETLGEPMSLGIGVNTGVARVGNTGSRRKFKYGPLGNTVNLASRVQGATKYLKTKLLVTGTTRARLGTEFSTRRVGKVRVINIAEPVELFELTIPGQATWELLRDSYEEALTEFEACEFRKCARILGNLVTEYRDDGPSLVLMSRAVSCMVEEPETFDPALRLPGK